MPQLRVILSLQAARDLDLLFDWIAYESGVARAEDVLQRIDDAIQRVATMPGIGRLRPELDGSPRTFPVSRWLIVYEPQKTNQGIVVWRVIDGARDLPRHIRRWRPDDG
jgi:toxin ParE1/3/4